MSTTPTFTAPVIVRECATSRTNKPMFSLADIKTQYGHVTWSTMGIQLNGSAGTASMNNMKYEITNVAVEKNHTKMNVFVTATDKHFVFTSKNVTDSIGEVTMMAKDLQLNVYNDNQMVVVIVGLLPNVKYMLFVDDNYDIYCTQV